MVISTGKLSYLLTYLLTSLISFYGRVRVAVSPLRTVSCRIFLFIFFENFARTNMAEVDDTVEAFISLNLNTMPDGVQVSFYEHIFSI